MEAGRPWRLGKAESGSPALLTHSGSLDKPLLILVPCRVPGLSWVHSAMTGEPGLLCSAGCLTGEPGLTENSLTAAGLVPV